MPGISLNRSHSTPRCLHFPCLCQVHFSSCTKLAIDLIFDLWAVPHQSHQTHYTYHTYHTHQTYQTYHTHQWNYDTMMTIHTKQTDDTDHWITDITLGEAWIWTTLEFTGSPVWDLIHAASWADELNSSILHIDPGLCQVFQICDKYDESNCRYLHIKLYIQHCNCARHTQFVTKPSVGRQRGG